LFILRHLQKSSLHPLTNIKQGDYDNTDTHVGCHILQKTSHEWNLFSTSSSRKHTALQYYLQQTNNFIIP